ncbi:MAG: XdhC family protein [Candidatus Eremiobacteraeota bacterium]|nr:XdhC family protein [Candidatus Eremiobacteraeota bacterium]
MSDVFRTLENWRAAGDLVVLATVINVDGSAPREPGAKMLVSAQGKISGSVSGGCVEAAVAEEAQSVLASGQPKIVRYGINRNMVWDVGLACGGAIDVFIDPDGGPPSFEPLTDDETAWALCTVVRGAGVGSKVAVWPHGRIDGMAGDLALRAHIVHAALAQLLAGSSRVVAIGDCEIFIDVLRPAPRLIIVGAVHVAVALCEFATRAGFDVTVIDPRARLNDFERFPKARARVVEWPDAVLRKLRMDDDTYVAVLTHDAKFDDPTLDLVLRSSTRYVGAIGSKKTQALRRARLVESGIPSTAVDRLHAPIGLDIGARSPEEIAVAILAEMIAVRYGHRGSPLKDRVADRIHA